MGKLNTELFIARRMGRVSDGESKGVMVRIATVTTAIGIAVMIVAVAVIMGFRREIADKITAFGGHLRVQALDYGGSFDTAPIRLDATLEADVASIPGFRAIAPYALKMGVVRTDDATQGIALKGVDEEYDLSFFEESLREGALPRLSDSVLHKDILISVATARMLKLRLDDRVEILFVSSDRPPRRDRFRVCGLYSSGMDEMDGRFAVTDIRAVQRLGGWDGDRVTGYEITIDDMKRLQEFEVEAYARVLALGETEPPLAVRSVTGDYPQLFDWLKTHDVNGAVIIVIMIVVALVSMTSALLIILLERIRMIGILKALGMNDGAVRRIFILRSARIIVMGLLIGNVVGTGLALLQKYTGAIKLDESGYFLPAVPIELGWWWIVALNVGTLAVLVALLVFPTSIVSRITPEKTIRYQ